jgi:hypothetical protein
MLEPFPPGSAEAACSSLDAIPRHHIITQEKALPGLMYDEAGLLVDQRTEQLIQNGCQERSVLADVLDGARR